MEESQYFVQLRDPIDIRRSILGSSKQIIHILQRYERIKELRVRKLEKIEELKKINKEINLSIAKLKKALPAADYRVKIGKEEKRMKTTGRKAISGDELRGLESELRMIEEKIGRLG
ncbi:hypothetical protein KY363_01450 [Candidatus Woesearchaeota archaeon]|nr:hypothetical protein [Candidatus Woesearchaeota archaeon]